MYLYTGTYPHEYSVSTRSIRGRYVLYERFMADFVRDADVVLFADVRDVVFQVGFPRRSRRLWHASDTAAPPRPRGTLKCAGERVRGARSDGRKHRVHT